MSDTVDTTSAAYELGWLEAIKFRPSTLHMMSLPEHRRDYRAGYADGERRR